MPEKRKKSWSSIQPEDAGEAEEVLVLDPAGLAPLVDLDAEPVAPFTNQVGDLELAGGEAVLGIADELSVEVDVHRALDAVEAQDDALTGHP